MHLMGMQVRRGRVAGEGLQRYVDQIRRFGMDEGTKLLEKKGHIQIFL